MIALGVDPGRVTGIALVRWVAPGRRPVLLGCWRVTGPSWARWLASLETALTAARELLPDDHIATGQPDPEQVLVGIEEPPPVVRRWQHGSGRPRLGTRLDGRLAGDSTGLRSWVGIGRRQGAVLAAAMGRGWPEPLLVPQSEWVAAWRIPRGKKSTERGLGWHRVDEAGLHLEGAAELLERIPRSYRVDVAEAALLAGSMILPRRW